MKGLRIFILAMVLVLAISQDVVESTATQQAQLIPNQDSNIKVDSIKTEDPKIEANTQDTIKADESKPIAEVKPVEESTPIAEVKQVEESKPIEEVKPEVKQYLPNTKEDIEIEPSFGISGFLSFLFFGCALFIAYLIKEKNKKYDFLNHDDLDEEMAYSLLKDQEEA